MIHNELSHLTRKTHGATVSGPIPNFFVRGRRPSQASDAFHAVHRVASVVALSPDASPSTPRRSTLQGPTHVPEPERAPTPPRLSNQWLHLFPEPPTQIPEPRDRYNSAPSHPSASRSPPHGQASYEPPIPATQGTQSQRGAVPMSGPAVYDFSHLDRGGSFSSSSRTLILESRTTLYDSPRPVTERMNTYASTSRGAQPQDTIGNILSEIDQYHDARMDPVPQPWSESPNGTIDSQSYYNQHPLHYDRHDSDTWRY